MAQRQWLGTQGHDHGTPEHAERSEDQHAEQPALTQQPVVPVQPELSNDQRPITRPQRPRLPRGQVAPQHQGQQHQQPRGNQVHTAPASQVGKPARDQPRQQNAQHHAAGDGAHGLPLLAGGGKARGMRHHHLHHDRHQPGDDKGQQH